MKLFRMFFRSVRDSFKSVFRNFSLSLASISCITITLIIVAIAIMGSLNIDSISKNIKKDVTIVVFLNENFDSSKADRIKSKIEQLDNINSVTFKSKEEEKQELQASSSELNTVISTWETNPLLDSLLVTVNDLENIQKTADEINSLEEVEMVNYGEAWVNKLITTFKIVEKATIASVIALVLVTVFLIINTIKLTIFSRKREISIMRLVGASNFTIKMPFVIEGMFLGLIGSIIPVIITMYGYFAVYNHFDGQLFSPLLKLIKPEPFIYMTSGIVILIGIIVGMLGSYKAVKKYLKI